MRLFVNLGDTYLKRHFNQDKHSMTIEVPIFQTRQKLTIEIFGISNSKRENKIFENYEMTKMDNEYISFEPCSLYPDDEWKITMLLLPTIFSNHSEKVLVPVSSGMLGKNEFSLGIDYDCSESVEGEKLERHTYITTVKFIDLARANIVFGKASNPSAEGKQSIQFAHKYRFIVKRMLNNSNIKNTMLFESHTVPSCDDFGTGYYLMNEIRRRCPKPVFIRA